MKQAKIGTNLLFLTKLSFQLGFDVGESEENYVLFLLVKDSLLVTIIIVFVACFRHSLNKQLIKKRRRRPLFSLVYEGLSLEKGVQGRKGVRAFSPDSKKFCCWADSDGRTTGMKEVQRPWTGLRANRDRARNFLRARESEAKAQHVRLERIMALLEESLRFAKEEKKETEHGQIMKVNDSKFRSFFSVLHYLH